MSALVIRNKWGLKQKFSWSALQSKAVVNYEYNYVLYGYSTCPVMQLDAGCTTGKPFKQPLATMQHRNLSG